MRTITLSDEEYELLILALGTAAGFYSKERMDIVPLIKLINAVCKDDPEFVPYEVKQGESLV